MTQRALLFIADVGGYTEFMRLHRLNLAHSQEVTQQLLESMLDAVPALSLVEVEGDALFLSAPSGDEQVPATADACIPPALAMHRAFHSRQRWMVAHNLCICDACQQIGRLRVKFVAHLGEVATQKIRNTEKLVGVDVIAVHRMLKNDVPASEYVLMSEPLYRQLGPELRARAVPAEQELEGLGKVPLYFVPLETPTSPLFPQPSLPARIRETARFSRKAFPRLAGRRET
jgi:hypothetical protein